MLHAFECYCPKLSSCGVRCIVLAAASNGISTPALTRILSTRYQNRVASQGAGARRLMSPLALNNAIPCNIKMLSAQAPVANERTIILCPGVPRLARKSSLTSPNAMTNPAGVRHSPVFAATTCGGDFPSRAALAADINAILTMPNNCVATHVKFLRFPMNGARKALIGDIRFGCAIQRPYAPYGVF
jgi:hypothetical protein